MVGQHRMTSTASYLVRVMIDREPVSAVEACSYALEHTKGPLDPVWSEERWSKGMVTVASLRTAHPDFRGVPIPKESLMTAVLDQLAPSVEDGSLPTAASIKAGFDLPAIMVAEDEAGGLYVLDGQCRVLTALWHHVETIPAYVFRERGRRQTP